MVMVMVIKINVEFKLKSVLVLVLVLFARVLVFSRLLDNLVPVYKPGLYTTLAARSHAHTETKHRPRWRHA